MKLEELYQKCDGIINGLRITPIDHFIFDLTDENSQNSLKNSFQGIGSVIMPECGNYLEVTTIVEDPECLMLIFPEQSDGSVGFKAFNTKTNNYKDLMEGQATKVTLDNFNTDFANMEEIANRFNQFAFNPESKDSTTEVIGSFDVSNDEPVDITTNTTTEEETEMKFKPISEEEATKWVEIPNTNAGGVRVTEDETAEDPFAGEVPADDGQQQQAAEPTDGGDATAEAPAETVDGGEGDATAEAPAEEAPAETTEEVDDPKAKMRELLAYYTNYMTELVQDPNTSTDLISATQEMIDSLIKNMESADAIEEVQADAEEEVSAEETPAEPTDAAAADGAAEQPVQEETDPQAEMNMKIDAEVDELHKNDWENIEPATSDNILTPGDLSNTALDNVDISHLAPTEDEDLAATAPDMSAPPPTSDEFDDVDPLTQDEEDELLGKDDYVVGADGLPTDQFDGDLDTITATPVEKKIQWSQDYALSGIATSNDNCVVVPQALKELQAYYAKVADEVSKVPGKEDLAMKLQKIQILSQTIANEWNTVISGLGDTCVSSLERDAMSGVEKDEYDSVAPMMAVSDDVMAQDELDEEDDLKIMGDIQAFAESFKHLI